MPNLFNTDNNDSLFEETCVFCKTNINPIIVPNRFVLSDDPYNSPLGASMVSVYPGVECKTTNVSSFSGCKYYYEYENGKYGCLRCEDGFWGIINF